MNLKPCATYWRGGTAGKVGGAAAGFSDMIRAALDKIDALQKCAENPTNPVLAGSCSRDFMLVWARVNSN